MNLLVIGGGKMGVSHLAILNRLLPARSVSVCDPSRLTRFLFSRVGVPAYASLDAALASGTPWGGAVIASPTPSHFGLAKSLLERGVPCFVEKPLTLDPARSQQLLDLQRQRGVCTQMGLVLRFLQPFVRLREIVRSGVLGRPLSYEACMLGNVISKPDNDSWRTDFRRGGGCLNEYGPHLLDLCRYFFGDVQGIASAAFGRVHSVQADDSATIAWTHGSGVDGRLRLDWCDTSRRKSYTAFEVQFERGRVMANISEIVCTPDDAATLDADARALLTAPTLPYPVGFYLRGEEFTLQLETFLERISGQPFLRAPIDKTLAADLEDGWAVDCLIRDIARLGGQQ